MTATQDVIEYGPVTLVLGDRYKASCAKQSKPEDPRWWARNDYAVRCSRCPNWASVWLDTPDDAKAEAADHAVKHLGIAVREVG